MRGNLSLLFTLLFTYSCGLHDEHPVVFHNGQQFTHPDAVRSSAHEGSYVLETTVGTLEKKELVYDEEFGLVSKQIVLQQAPWTRESFRQPERSLNYINLNQGHSGVPTEQTYQASEAGVIDILIVVDDSSSMDLYRQNLSERLTPLLSYIYESNWQIAVTTTSSPCLASMGDAGFTLKKTSFNGDFEVIKSYFRQAILNASGNAGRELGIEMSIRALAGECSGNWVRELSDQIVLLVTDERNCGSASNEGCIESDLRPEDFYNSPYTVNTKMFGLLLEDQHSYYDGDGMPEQCFNSGGWDSLPQDPAEYKEIIAVTGGTYSDICLSDYTEVLTGISELIKNDLRTVIELENDPYIIDSVTVDEQEVGFLQSGRVLEITSPIADELSVIRVNYRHSPVSIFNRISIPSYLDRSTLSVTIDHVPQSSSDYVLDEVQHELIFHSVPPERSDIQLSFLRMDDLQDRFFLESPVVGDRYAVFVDGLNTTADTILENEYELVFQKIPRDNQEILVFYEREEDKKRNYLAIDVSADQIESVIAKDALTKQIIPITIDDEAHIVFEDEDIYDGRHVSLEYNLDAGDLNFKIPLEGKLWKPSLELISSGKNLNSCQDTLKVDHEFIYIECADKEFDSLTIRYLETMNYQNAFYLPIDFTGPLNWSVDVNGQPIKDFYLFGSTVIILEDHLPMGSRVRIEAFPKLL